MRTRLLLALTALAGLTASPSSAAPANHSFTGTCVLTGLLSSQAGVGWVPGRVQWDVEVRGHCSGVLDGERVKAHATSLREVLRGDMEGCLPAGTSTLEGELDFGRGRRIAFTGTQAVVPAAVLQGRVSGTAASVQTAYSFAGGGGSQECTAGEYRSGGFEVRLRADAPLVG